MATSAAIDKFRSAAGGYLNDERFSDFTIVCEGTEHKVHRCFIAAHSKWFERACSGMFHEASSQKVELQEDLPTAVERMIRFFYTCDYDDAIDTTKPKPKYDDKEPSDRLQVNAWMYATADKYDVPSLKTLAVEKFAKLALEASSHPMGLMPATHTVYKHIQLPESDRTLKDILTAMWMLGGKVLLGSKEITLVSFATEVPEFMADLTRLTLTGSKPNVRQVCKLCAWSGETPRGTMMPGAFKCGRISCHGTESNDYVTLISTVTVKKPWLS